MRVVSMSCNAEDVVVGDSIGPYLVRESRVYLPFPERKWLIFTDSTALPNGMLFLDRKHSLVITRVVIDELGLPVPK